MKPLTKCESRLQWRLNHLGEAITRQITTPMPLTARELFEMYRVYIYCGQGFASAGIYPYQAKPKTNITLENSGKI